MWVIHWGKFYEPTRECAKAIDSQRTMRTLPNKADSEDTLKFTTFDKAESFICKHYGQSAHAIIEHIK